MEKETRPSHIITLPSARFFGIIYSFEVLNAATSISAVSNSQVPLHSILKANCLSIIKILHCNASVSITTPLIRHFDGIHTSDFAAEIHPVAI